MDQATIPLEDYLQKKNITYRQIGDELVTHCVFSDCDQDSRGTEAHLYFNIKTSLYHCKKCGAKGNLFTLARHLGDDLKDFYQTDHSNGGREEVAENSQFDKTLVEKSHLALPDHLSKYLNKRGVSDETIREARLGMGQFYGKWWITIPIKNSEGQFTHFKLRRLPGIVEDQEKYKFYPSGSKASLYGAERLKDCKDMVMICEGEFDRLLLEAHGISSVCSTGGAGTFKESWVESFKGIAKIYICYDRDQMGQNGADKVADLLKKKLTDAKIYQTLLPEEMKEGKDITDYFTVYQGTSEDLIDKHSAEVRHAPGHGAGKERVFQVGQIEKPTSFAEWKETITSHFPGLAFPAEVALSIISQILIRDITNPFGLVLVDVPSSGKTTLINFFSNIEGLTYTSDRFTPASFVSHAANIRKERLEEIDLLPRLQYKMFLLRDLSTLFSRKEEDLKESLGILTRLLDGEGLNTDSGVHGRRQYAGEYMFTLLAGSTPVPPRIWKIMGNLGARLFFLDMGSSVKSDEELASQISSTAYKEKEKHCRRVTEDFLYTLWRKYPQGLTWNSPQDPKEFRIIIARCSRLLAKLRGVINIWKEKGGDSREYSYTLPVVEMPDRINQLLYNFCRGHALVCGRKQINEDDLQVMVELAIDSAPTTRARIFKALVENNGVLRTSQIEGVLHCSKRTALKEMEALNILEVCETVESEEKRIGKPEKAIRLVEEFQWLVGEE